MYSDQTDEHWCNRNQTDHDYAPMPWLWQIFTRKGREKHSHVNVNMRGIIKLRKTGMLLVPRNYYGARFGLTLRNSVEFHIEHIKQRWLFFSRITLIACSVRDFFKRDLYLGNLMKLKGSLLLLVKFNVFSCRPSSISQFWKSKSLENEFIRRA